MATNHSPNTGVPQGADDEFGTCYESPAEGLKELASAFNYWTGKITDSSLQLCLAIVAGNWAVHQTRDALLANWVALWSLLAVLLAFGLNLVGALVLACLHKNHFYSSQSKRAEWIESWRSAERTPMEWPYTHQITFWGFFFTVTKVVIVLAAGILFVVGAIRAIPST